MNTILLAYALLFGVSGVACLASIPRARTIRHPGTRRALVVFLGAVALWCGGYLGYLLTPTTTGKLAAYILGFVFAFVAVAAWVVFCAEYTGRPVRDAPLRIPIFGLFLLFVVLKLTNPIHQLYFTTTWRTQPFPHLAIEHQLLYWIVLGLSYAVILVGFYMLAERLYYTGADSRPLLVLVAITGVPAIVTILSDQIETLLPVMYEPPGVAVFAIGTLFVYFDRFEAIRLTTGTAEPAIYLDRSNRIRDYNRAAEAIFPTLSEAIGEPIETVNATLADRISDPGVVAVTTDGETHYREVSTTPFLTGDIQTGCLVTIADVTDRESYRQQLELQTEQLEALNRVVRHDIRNDMAVVLGWAESLHDHVDAEGAEALDRIIRSSEHVVELIETARDFVESLTDDGVTELKPVPIRRIIETEVATIRDSYSDAHVAIDGEIPDVAVLANGMVSSIFRNLLENAIRHSDKPTPEVTVSGAIDGDIVRIRVADNGPGIPDDRVAEIFGKGEKGLDSPGSGIGLYLVQTLVTQYGGEVWVEDADPTGAVFVVELPIDRSASTDLPSR